MISDRNDEIERMARQLHQQQVLAKSSLPHPRIEDIPPVWNIEASAQRWLVDGLVPAGAITLVTGASGVGKSMVTLAIAGAVVRGESFAGRQCRRAPVLVLDRENPLAVAQDRLALFKITQTPDFTYWGMWVDQEPASPTNEELKAFAAKRPLLIFDSLVAFHTGSEQDATETRAFMQHIRRLTGLGATVILIHHTGKGESTKDYRGSSDIPAAVDAAYVVERGEGSSGLERLTIRNFKMRVAEGVPRIAIELRDGRFEASGDPFVLETSKARDELLRIVSRCPAIGKTAAVEELRAAAKISKRRAKEIVDAAIESDELIAEKGGVGGGERLRVNDLAEVEI